MGYYDEWKKKRASSQSEESTDAETEQKSEPKSYYQEWMHKNKSSGYYDWLKRVGELSDTVSSDYDSRDGKYQSAEDFGKYYSDKSAQIQGLLDEGQGYLDYFAQYSDVYSDEFRDYASSKYTDVSDYLKRAGEILASENEMWSQFENEEEYLATQMLTDFDAAGREIERLQGLYDMASEIKYKPVYTRDLEIKKNALKYEHNAYERNQLEKDIQQLESKIAQIEAFEKQFDYSKLGDLEKDLAKRKKAYDLAKGYKAYEEQVAAQNKLNEEYLAYDDQAGLADIDSLKSQIAGLKGDHSFWDRLSVAATELGMDIFRNDEAMERDADIDELEALVSEKMDYHDKATAYQRLNKLITDAQRDEDFDAYAKAGMEIENPSPSFWSVKEDDVGNIVTYSRDNVELIESLSADRANVTGDSKYAEMTEDEVKVYSYYLAKFGKETAQEYLDLIDADLIEREKNRELAELGEWASQNVLTGLLASAGSVLTSLGSGVEYVGDVLKYGVDQLKDPYTAKMDTNSLAETTNAVRGAVTEKVNLEIDGWDAFDFVYNTTMSGVDSFAAAYIPGGAVVLGLSAAAQGTNDALERGLSSDQAFWNGVVNGVFEGLFESVSISQIPSLQAAAVANGKDIAYNIAKSMLVNASEETCTEVANIVYDILANGDLSNYEIMIRDYVDDGMSLEEAQERAKSQLVSQILESGASGALMGAGFGGIGSAVGYANYKKTDGYISAKQNTEVLSMLDRISRGEFKDHDKVYLNNINDNIAVRIRELTGINVSGFKVAIEARQLKHILKDHGESGKTDSSMKNPEDIAKIEYVLNNPDVITKSGKTQAYSYMKNGYNRTADTVLYEKNIGEQSYYAVQAIPDTKAKTLYIVTAFIGQSGYQKGASQLINANSPNATSEIGSAITPTDSISQGGDFVNGNFSTKKGSTDQLLNMDSVKSPQPTPEASFDGSATNSSISQKSGNVNSKFLTSGSALDRAVGVLKLNESERTVLSEVMPAELDDAQQLNFAAAFSVVYRAALSGKDIGSINSSLVAEADLSQNQIQEIYYRGRLEYLQNLSKNNSTNATESDITKTKGKEAQNEKERDGVRLRDSSKRNGGQDTGRKVSAVEDRTGQAESRRDDGNRPRDREAPALTYEKEVSAKSLGIEGGLDSGRVYLIAEGSETAAMKRAKKRAEKRGLKVTFFAGDNIQIEQDGEVVSARGYIKGDDVYIRVDHPYYTADQLMRHEIGHDMINRGEVDVDAVRKRIEARFSDVDFMIELYTMAYEGSDLSAEEIWEEIICDSLGDMNAFAPVEVLGEINAEFLDLLKAETYKSQKDARGPPRSVKGDKAKFSISPALESELDAVLNGTFDASKNEVYLGETSNFMTDVIGAEALSLYMPASKAYSSLVTEEEYNKKPYYAKQDNYHGIGKANFIEILKKSEAPIAAFAASPDESGNKRQNRIVLVTDKLMRDVQSGKNGYAVVVEEVDTKGLRKGKRVNANKTITIYPRTQLLSDIQNAIIDGRILNFSKKGEHLFAGVRGSNPQAAIRKDVLDKNIAHFWANVKWEKQKNKIFSTKEAEMPSAFRLALEKAGYIDQDGHIKYMQEGEDLSHKKGSSGKASIEIDVAQSARRALDEFGVTGDFDMTGFVLEGGQMLKLSPYGLKGVNHSLIGKIYDDVKGSAAVNRFIQEGNVRIKASSPGIEIGAQIAPSVSQYNMISRFISRSLKSKGVFYLDITDADGQEIGSVTYDDSNSTEDVIYDIKKFYRTGEVRKSSSYGWFSRDLDFVDFLNENAEEREFSNREILANLLETENMTPSEKAMLTRYRNKIAQIEANESEIDKMQSELKKLRKAGQKNSPRAISLEEMIKTRRKEIARDENAILNIESMKPIKRLLENTRKSAYDEGTLIGKMEQGRRDATARRALDEKLKQYREARRKSVEGRSKTAVRHKIANVVAELDKLLRHGNKKSNVKLGLQSAVASALEVFDHNSDKVKRYQKSIADLDARIAAATDPVEIEALTELRDKKKRNSERLSDKLQVMKKAYEDIHNGRDGENYPSYYKAEAEAIENRIAEVIEKVGDTSIGDMSLDQLEAVYGMYRMVLTTVQNANKVFRDGKLADLTEDATEMENELQRLKKLPEERLKAGDSIRGFVWNELTPYYAFNRIGSRVLMGYYDELVRGQDVYARDITEAKDFAEETRAKHGYSKWKLDKVHHFKDKDGRNFDLTLKHMMSIYAYSKREQALDHMEKGGFFFNNKETFRKKGGVLEFIASNESGYKVDAQVFATIKGALTAEQIAYVDEMQEYLTLMGEKGNEVSRVMWGIDIFKEKVYFPLKSKEDFIYQANTPAETSSLKNDGMTKETRPHASNPIVLEAFDDVWASHVNKMSTYHGFVVPIDNLNKLVNYGTWMEGKKITPGMSDAERYDVLRDTDITVGSWQDNNSKSENDYSWYIANLENLHPKAKSKAEKIMRDLAEELGILNVPLNTPVLDFDFVFSKNRSLPESLSKQLKYGGNYADFAKVLINLRSVLSSAILIEQHTDKYEGKVREDRNLKSVYVLFSALKDGDSLIPVQLEIKDYSHIDGRLYLTVALTKIEADVMGSTVENNNQAHSLVSASTYSIADIIKNVNTADKHFLKYVPNNFLSKEQINAKREALAEDKRRIEAMPDKEYDEQRRNYLSSENIEMGAHSISTMLEARFGSGVNEYLNTFIKDLNGAKAQNGTLMSGVFNLLSKFKKTAVAASLSVVVQQPTAIIRALSEIDIKHFAHLPKLESLNRRWELIQEYAPIAIIKDIGGFDTGSGRTTVEWLNSDTKRGVDKAMNKIDDLTMYGATLGDRIGWSSIWVAVEREVRAKQGLEYGSDEFYAAVGKRFTEVIVKTQVYDSTLSRSGFMRGKDGLMKMATAFMGEPTLSVNMMIDAVLQAKRGRIKAGKAARTIASVYTATLAASIVKSFIYALRDDDDDESYAEKYLQAFGGTILNDINPMNMLPLIRDAVSIFDGWDVERTDMALVADLKNAIDALDSDSKNTWRKIEDFAGAIAAFAGVPLKNAMRTAREMYNLVENVFDGIHGGNLGGAFVEGVTGKEMGKSESLYGALINGDTERIEIYKKTYKSEAAYQSAVRRALRENDRRVQQAVEGVLAGKSGIYSELKNDVRAEKHFDVKTVNEAFADEREYVLGKLNDARKARREGDTAEYNKIVEQLIKRGYSEEFVKRKLK